MVKRKTASSRFSRALQRIAQWCRRNRHLEVKEQHRILSQKLRGHYAYYGITGNSLRISSFKCWVERIWYKWLSRRDRKGLMAWEAFSRLLRQYPLPAARAVHSVYRRAANP